MTRKLPAPVAILWKGQPAEQITGWQAAPNGDPKRATTVIRVNGRRRVAFAGDVRSA
jgi:hypothetical protein